MCSLAQNNDVCVALNWEDGFAPTRANDAAAGMLLESAVEHRIAEDAGCGFELDAVATRIKLGSVPLQSSGSVVFGEARGGEAEVALVASLTRAAIERGVSPERVAVVFGQVAPRLNLLRNAMAAEGIEYSVDCALTVGATAFGRAISGLLKLALGIGDRSEALIFLQGPFSDSKASTALRLDSDWRSGRRADDSARMLADIAKLDGQSGEVAGACRRLAGRPLDARSVQEWQILADSLISTAASSGGTPLEEQDASAYRSFTRAVSEMASVDGSPFGALDVLAALPLLSCSMLSEELAGHVQVIEASRIGARRFDELIVAGLTRSEFPLATRESFASDVQALSVGHHDADSRMTAELESYSLLTRPRNRLTLVRQTVNSDGTMQEASPLLTQIQDLYRGGEDTKPVIEVVRCEDVRAYMPVFTRGRRAERLLPAHAIRVSREVQRGALSPQTAEHFSRSRVFSATEIETYLRCPYSWFYSRVLRPRDIDSELDAAALGSRAHRLLSDFYGVMKQEGRARVTPETLVADLELFERSAALTERGMSRAQGLGEEIDTGRAHLWARHTVEDDAYLLAGYDSHAHELVFGDERVFEFAGAALSGRIDRVDVGPWGAVVTDYKSARDVGKLAGSGVGAGIQHILYAMASEELLGMPVVGSVYRSLRSRRMRGYWRADLLKSTPVEACERDLIDSEGFSAMVDELEARVSGAVDGITAGEIPRTPRSADSCAYCALNQICEGAL
jgi:CRISPR/Cas system-associated exonuclease Cas4 (RecB family)